LVDSNTRQAKRTPVTLKVKFKSETLDQFIERYAVDVSQGGIFIRTKSPQPVGTQMKFEFQLRDGAPLIGGEGTVVWIRELDPARLAVAPGMGVRFDRLAEGSPAVLERILNQKSRLASSPRPSANLTPAFNETPTRVANMPMADEERETTPLPSPMPFHSDADEFPDEAFEEATKVRSVEDLIAQTAMSTADLPIPSRLDASSPLLVPSSPGLTLPKRAATPTPMHSSLPAPAPFVTPAATPPFASSVPSAPEASPVRSSGLAFRRGDSQEESVRTLIDSVPPPPLETPMSSRTLVDPVSSSGRTLLDASPPMPPAVLPLAPSAAHALHARSRSIDSGPVRHEPMRAREPSRPPATSAPLQSAPAIAAPLRPAAPRMSLLIVTLLSVLAAAVALVWFLSSRQAAVQPNKAATAPTSSTSKPTLANSVPVPPRPVEPTPPTALLDTIIDASYAGATIEVVSTAQRGAAPLTAKLERGKSYRVKVVAPGFFSSELTVIGGNDNRVAAKLDAKPRTLQVTSTPSQSSVYIDGNPVKRTTPATIELSASQAERKLRVMVRRIGYQPFFATVKPENFTEESDRMMFVVNATLSVTSRAAPVPATSDKEPDTEPPPDASSGSPTPPEDPPAPPPAAPAPSVTPSATNSVGEPAPDWSK
jgi:uncharacterized protein (TIGR02266 family)